MTDEEKLKKDWWWVSDKFFAVFCNHKGAFEYHVKNNVVQWFFDDEYEKFLLKSLDKPWKMPPKIHELMNRYGITDDEMREAWKYACDWMNFSEKDFPCPVD